MYAIIFDESKIKLKNKKKIGTVKNRYKKIERRKKTLFKQSYTIILKF